MTADTWLHLYPAKILGFQDLDDHLLTPIRSGQTQVFADIFGAGGMLDTRATLTVTADEFTLSADREGWAPDGHRLELDSTDAIWQDVPFEDSGATVYNVGARWIDVPVTAQVGVDGLPHFGHVVEAVGETFTPDTVASDAGGGVQLVLTSIPDGMKATTSTEGRTCSVWYEDTNGDPLSASSTIAIETAQLVRNGAVWEVITSGTFGQGTLDTTAARYKVAVHGPIPYRATELPGTWAAEWLDLGTITSGVFDNSAAPLVNDFGTTIVAFNAEHDSVSGVHTDVTADQIDVGTTTLTPAAGRVTAESLYGDVVVVREPTADSDANNHVVVGQLDGTPKVILRAGDPAATSNLGGGALHFPNPDETGGTADAAISTTYAAGDVDLWITNSSGVRQLVPRIDGAIRKNPGKAVPFALQADDAADEVLELENIGAGVLHLQLSDGDLTLDTGDVIVTAGDVSAVTFTGALWSADAAGVVDAVNFTGPLVTLTPGVGDVAYAYNARVEHTVDYAPTIGGWNEVDDGTASTGGGVTMVLNAAQYVHPTGAGGDTTVLRLPMDAIFNHYRSSPADASDRIRINSIAIRYTKGASDTLLLRLERFARDGLTTGLIATINPTASGTFAADSTGVIDHVVDQDDFVYYLELSLRADSTATDCKVSNVLVTYDLLGIG